MSRPKELSPGISIDDADALEVLFEASVDGVALISADGRLARLNAQGRRDLEAEDPATILGRDWVSLWPPEARDAAGAALQKAWRGEKAAFQGLCPSLRGAPRWWDVVLAPILKPSGAPSAVFAILREASDRAAHGQAFVTLVEGGVIAGWSAQAQTLFGWSTEEAIGLTVDRILPKRLHAASRIWSDGILATGDAEHLGQTIKTTGVRRTGEEFPVECVISALPAASGWMLLASIQDVSTTRAQTELFENTFQNAPIGQALVSLEGRFLKLNPAFCSLLECDEATLLAGGFQSITHPDDLDLDLACLKQLVAGEIADYQIDKRYIRPDGSLVWVNLSVSLVRFADGRPKFFISQVQDLTARRKAEGRYRLLAENASDVVSLQDKAGRCLFVSPSAERVFGYKPEDVLGKAPFDFLPDDAHRSYRALAESLADRPRGETVTRQLPLLRKDGGASWIEISCRHIDDEDGQPVTVVVTRDISQRLETERRYRLLADNMADILVLADLEGRVSFVAGACERILGWTPEEILTHRGRLAHPDDFERVHQAFRRVGQGEHGLRVRFRSHCKDGAWRWLESQPSLFVEENGVVGVVDAIRDVTDQVAQEAALALAREEAEAAALAKARFLANMSHEIRTPLTAVIGFTDLLLERHALQPEGRRCAEHIGSASRALLTLVNDVLDFSKIEAGQFDIRLAPAQPVRLVDEALAIFTAAAERKGIGVRLDTRLDEDLTVDIDAARVRQILLNLIGNAVKFTERGEVVVGVRRRKGRLTITVRDSGPGIASSDQRKLFQRFSQVDASPMRQHGGTGLGLAISKGLVEAMGGSISVRSRPGHGAAFTFEIAAPVSAEQPATCGAPTEDAHIDRVRILVADDNAANRELVRAILEGFGAELTVAADGREACEQASASPFDVILMDLRMPNLDGRGALRQIRASAGPNQHTPVLAFTADVLETDVADFDGAVGKPIEPGKLAAAIEACLSRSAQPVSDAPGAAGLGV